MRRREGRRSAAEIAEHEGEQEAAVFVELKQAAERIAKGVDGVKRVDNNLTVGEKDRTLGEAVDDTSIATRVKTALAADTNTKAYQIKVDVNGGNVELGGFVDSESSKDNASRVARSVEGVKGVQNNIVVQK